MDLQTDKKRSFANIRIATIIIIMELQILEVHAYRIIDHSVCVLL